MKEKIISELERKMFHYLNKEQRERLRRVVVSLFESVDIVETVPKEQKARDYIGQFIQAKRIEGCSEKSLRYYRATLEKLENSLNVSMRQVTTEQIRDYLSAYQEKSKCSRVTVDNVRRIFSSFFSWMEDEDYVIKSPVRRIHKIRTGTTVKETYTDEQLEQLRDQCKEPRDLAMIDLLTSTGMRVGELVNLDIADLNFEERECVVFGKGNKERKVYFDARTKLHLRQYLDSRQDDNPAVFVSLDRSHHRLKTSGVELRLKKLGEENHIRKVHPHKFRRTMATRAIDKGMPIEQLQRLLGHAQIDTTLRYAMVNQSNVKNSHRRYIG